MAGPSRSIHLAVARIALAASAVAPLASGCAPPFATLQSARTVPPGHVELTPSYSAVTATYDGETEKIEDVYGLQCAVGIAPGFEFRFAYALLSLDHGSAVNVLGFGPKFAVVPDHMAVYMPAGFAFSNDFGEDFDSMETWELQPTLLWTGRLHQYVEINPSTKFILPLSNGSTPLVAFNLGFGLSSNLDLWAMRPEIGFLVNPAGEGYKTSYSIGLSITPPW
jgi:hypothetical protein